MRELDLLLISYLDNDYAHATTEDQQAFRELLALADPDLIGYFLGGQLPGDSAIASVVRQIRDRPQA